ncbi:MAG: MFS transporter [Planctomycetota bacterium]
MSDQPKSPFREILQPFINLVRAGHRLWSMLVVVVREIVQPFIDLVHAPRALWGINLAYMLEGMVYFGILGYLAIHFSDFVFRGLPPEAADIYSHKSVMVLTAGITLAMVFLGFVADKWGVRRALMTALAFMLAGRVVISAAPTLLRLQPAGLWSSLHLVTMGGMVLVVIGYGMYQPAAYAGVRQFTTPKTAAMGFAMLYALMNLGGWFPMFAFLLRDEDFLNLGIPGTFWVYTGFTLVALLCTILILSPHTVRKAIAAAKEETARITAGKGQEPKTASDSPGTTPSTPTAPEGKGGGIPLHLWGVVVGVVILLFFALPRFWWYMAGGVLILAAVVTAILPPAARWVARHPLADTKFFYFVFALIPVQTLFTYNWFVLPQYIQRTYEGWIGKYFEIFSNQNPLLIFILAPIIAAVTQKRKVYNMMILGTFIMAVPAFLPAIKPTVLTLAGYIVLMTIGEAMWQPRFLQYAAEIAPEGRTGMYMGVAQLPWFLTKVLVPAFYSGKMLAHYCPKEGPKNTETMWFIFGCIALCSCLLLLAAKGWIGKDFKTKAA